jgi:myo-inositol 2-dehydrogenase/D-chiro-inositol 1-dehydrogenase
MAIGIGMIGYAGAASRLHLPVLTRLKGVRVTAIAGTTQATLTATADRYAIPARYLDYESLLHDPSVDAVAVCAPPVLHESIGLAAIQANKHLFMEKPLALSLKSCALVVHAADSSSVTTMVGFHLRWHRLVREGREWIASGRLGTVQLLRTVFTSGIRWRPNTPAWRQRRETGGGVLIESGVHYYDLWRFLTGSEVEEVQATSCSERHDDVTATVTARLENGILATAGFCQATTDDLRIDIYGSAGHLLISGYALDGLRFNPSGHKGLWKAISNARSVPRRVLLAVRGAALGGYYPNAYENEWEGFVRAIESGKPEGATLSDGMAATRVALAATQSASSGRSVRVADCVDMIAPVHA